MIDLAKYLRDPGRILRKLRWRRLYHGPAREVTVDSWNGRLTFNSRDRFISKYLYVDRAYEPRTIDIAMRTLGREPAMRGKGRGMVLDIGANIGMISTALLTHGWYGRSVCFEPSPENLRLLRINVAQNALDARVTIVGCALSSAPGQATFELSESNAGDNRVRPAEAAAGAPGAYHEDQRRTITVPVDTLDHALKGAGMDAHDVSLIWMDIQGHEAECLAGASATLSAGMPVVMEFWPYGLARAGTSREAFLALARRCFSRAIRLLDDGAVPMSIEQVGALYDEVDRPNKMTQLLFLRDGR
jgi:FkbM family methyltransferase